VLVALWSVVVVVALGVDGAVAVVLVALWSVVVVVAAGAAALWSVAAGAEAEVAGALVAGVEP
jgi:hypothetical protein